MRIHCPGLDVVILPDTGEAGGKHAGRVSPIYGKAQTVKALNIPNLPEKEDDSDWIERGGNLEKRLKSISNAEEEPTLRKCPEKTKI